MIFSIGDLKRNRLKWLFSFAILDGLVPNGLETPNVRRNKNITNIS